MTLKPFCLEGFRDLQSNPQSRTNFKAKSNRSGLYPVNYCASPRFEPLYILRSDKYWLHFTEYGGLCLSGNGQNSRPRATESRLSSPLHSILSTHGWKWDVAPGQRCWAGQPPVEETMLINHKVTCHWAN